MKGIISRSTVTSVNNVSPDTSGNVAIDFPVTSVNGKTGAVTVDIPVTSVNGQTGAVTVNVPVTSVDGKTGAVTTGAYTSSNPPPYPVTKVNNKTGAVSLSASDVGAMASDKITFSLSGTTLTITVK